MLTLNKAMSFHHLDTLATWQIYVGDKLVTAGREPNSRTPDPGTITIKEKIEELIISYRYDVVKPEVRTIVIKSETETLYDQTQHLKDNHPTSIDMNEILKNHKGTFEVQVFCTDDIITEENRLIGRIRIKIE